MKQHVTQRQFQELSKVHKRKLEDYFEEPLTAEYLTIGKMIEVLESQDWYVSIIHWNKEEYSVDISDADVEKSFSGKCRADCLFEAIKYIPEG